MGKNGEKILPAYAYSGADIVRNVIRIMHASYIGFHGYAKEWRADNPPYGLTAQLDIIHNKITEQRYQQSENLNLLFILIHTWTFTEHSDLKFCDLGVNLGFGVEYNNFFSIAVFYCAIDRCSVKREGETPIYQNNVTFSLVSRI